MKKVFSFLITLFPLGCLGQFIIKGRIINQSDGKPVVNASVFLNNATSGAKSGADGTFVISNLRSGKYDLVVSDIRFEAYSEAIEIDNADKTLPVIALSPKTIDLKGVKITYHADPDRQKYLNEFTDEFLGRSAFANECKILNPDILDLDYNDDTKTLNASTGDFLKIENDALGYRLNYLIKNFSVCRKAGQDEEIRYMGSVLFEELKGRPAQERRWMNNRQEAYANSPMHFLRSAVQNQLEKEGFRVQLVSVYPNPERPSDNFITEKIEFFKNIKLKDNSQRDSLSCWEKKSKLQKSIQKLMPAPLSEKDIIRTTDKAGQYALSCDYDGLLVAYSKNHHFHISDHFNYLYNANNDENTLIRFNEADAFFYKNGVITNPYSVEYYGVWGRNRVAELLPIDYMPGQAAEGSGANDRVESSMIQNRLDSMAANHPVEKAYLQLDKPYYAAGDTIYFKAYLTMGERHVLSNISGVLHVDLISPQNKLLQSINLQSGNGVAWGDFALPDSLAAGNYRLRTWTRWMRNDPGSFFEKVVPVGSLQNRKVSESAVPKKRVNNIADLQFFPEGGSLVEGLKSRIAFKATGTNGLGIMVKGVVLDNENKAVCTFAAAHLGMGSFELTPQPGETYRAKATFADGSENIINLPAAQETGIGLAVDNDSIPKASVRIMVDPAYYAENKGKSYRLLIYSGGVANTVDFRLDSLSMKMDIIKRRLFTGIATITLFSETNEPLCERLIFVQNYDQLNLHATTDKTVYTTRQKVNIDLHALTRDDEPAVGHFSVSVTDEDKVPENEDDETTILSHLLLTSDLKGYVEQPNYYFTNITDKTTADLDLVMLTHGYRRFEWKKLLSGGYPTPKYEPETGLEISGTATTQNGKPLIHGTVSLVQMQGPFISRQTDDKGNFVFKDLIFTDSTRFILQAVNARNRNNTKLTYVRDLPEPLNDFIPPTRDTMQQNLATYLVNTEKQQEQLNMLGLGKGRMLKGVTVKARKPDDNYFTFSFAGAGHADQVLNSKDLGYGPLISKLNGVLRGVIFNKDTAYLTLSLMDAISGKIKPMLVIVDGVEGYLLPTGLQATDVETVEVLKNASSAIYGMQGAGGLLIITTKRGGGLDPKAIKSVGILPITVNGFYKTREFYSPKYDVDANITRPDLRSTIYWQPELATDKDGNASFEYYNADGTGTYRIVIEGIDDKGNIGRQVYRYKVE